MKQAKAMVNDGFMLPHTLEPLPPAAYAGSVAWGPVMPISLPPPRCHAATLPLPALCLRVRALVPGKPGQPVEPDMPGPAPEPPDAPPYLHSMM